MNKSDTCNHVKVTIFCVLLQFLVIRLKKLFIFGYVMYDFQYQHWSLVVQIFVVNLVSNPFFNCACLYFYTRLA